MVTTPLVPQHSVEAEASSHRNDSDDNSDSDQSDWEEEDDIPKKKS